MKRAVELDPLSAAYTGDVGIPLTYHAKYDAAKKQFHKALELDPSAFFAQWLLGWADVEAGRLDAGIREFEKAKAMDSPPFVTGFLGYAYAKSGDYAKAEAMITELNQMSSRRFVSPYCTAVIYLGLGDKLRALEGLEKAYEVRSQWMQLLRVDKIYDPLRSEPRFIELVKKTGLDK